MSEEEEQARMQRLQVLDQNLQQAVMQKQQFQSQLLEVEQALDQLDDTPQAYKLVGNLMIAASKEELKEDLSKKKDLFDLRVKTIEKQEKQLRDNLEALRKEVAKGQSEDEE